ncbi:MAG TPA: diguanylate cyclase [Thermoleophilaceae bacterium]|nr:diguanylate cyclase [Thermoleophilaceae bacterium]
MKAQDPASSTAHQLRSTEKTEAPNDSLPGPAALARSLGYAFVSGATVALVLTLVPNDSATNETGILSLVALAYTVGLICLRAEARLPSWATPAALALATILVTYAVEFFSDAAEGVWSVFYVAVGLQAGYFLNRLWAVGQVALVAAAYGLALWGDQGALEAWLGTVATVALATWMVGTMRVRVRALIGRLADAARTDAHTGLLNRRGLKELSELELERARRGDRPVSIVIIDLDRFGEFNETQGHATSDRALKAIAQVIQDSKRRIDIAARISGEEFALIAPDTDEHGAYVLADRLRREVREAFVQTGLTVSLGIASYPKHGSTAEELLTGADRAVFAAKALGRDRTVIYNREIAANLLGEQTRQAVLEEGHLAAVLVLAETLDMRDAGTARHSQLVGRYARSIAAEMDMDEDRIERMHLAGVLHDIGKIGIPDSILKKPGALDDGEWSEMRKHPELGARILEGAHLDDIAGWVLAHHERPDGQGYPSGLFGEQIPFEARILSVVDAYEAMTNDRVYRPAMPEAEARAELLRHAGTQFDPAIVATFVDLLEREDRSGESLTARVTRALR